MPSNLDFTYLTLDTIFWKNPLQDWLVAVGVALSLAIILTLIRGLVKHRLNRLAQFESILRFPVSRFVGALWTPVLWALSLYIGSRYLVLPPKAERFIDSGLFVACTVQAALWLGLLLDHWIRTKTEDQIRRDQAATATTLQAVGYIGRIAIWSVATLVMLDNLGVNVTALVAGLGVGGIAIALAAQNILGEMFASMSIVVDRPFVIGDFIAFDTNNKGTIEHIGLRSTRIRSQSGEELIVPNSVLLKANIRNYKRLNQRHAEFILNVSYRTPGTMLDKIPAIIQKIIEDTPNTKFGRVYLKNLGENALQFEVVYDFTHKDYGEYARAHHGINMAILRAFAKNKIYFALPVQAALEEGK